MSDSRKWADACLGHHAFKLPTEVSAGAYEPKFSRAEYGFPGLFGLMGGVSLGDADLFETALTDLETFDRTVRPQAFGEHHEATILKGLDEDGNIRRKYRLRPGNQGLGIQYPNSFAWRHLGTYSFGTWLETDRRVRIIKGKLARAEADRTSAAQELQALWSSYRSRHASEQPAEHGLCTAHGFLAEEKSQKGKAFSAYVSYRDESLWWTVRRSSKTSPNLGEKPQRKPSSAATKASAKASGCRSARALWSRSTSNPSTSPSQANVHD